MLRNISERERNLSDAINVMATPNFPFIARRRNTANISQLYDTCRIEGVRCVTKICYMRCIFAGMHETFIASAPNETTTPKKIQDPTLTPINWEACRFSISLNIAVCPAVALSFCYLGLSTPYLGAFFSLYFQLFIAPVTRFP